MHLLLALDGSDESMEAARFLSRFPLSGQHKVTLVNALDLVLDEGGVMLEKFEVEKARAQKILNKATVILQSRGFETGQVIESGHPSRLILDKGKELDVDLIVMGARGHSAAYRVILGSTANFVANHARCPVLIVRPSRESPADDAKFRVLLAYDGSPSAEIAREQLFSCAWPPESTIITLATFFEKPRLLSNEDVYDQKAIDEGGKVLAEIRAQAGCKCEIRQVVQETRHIGDALRNLAEQNADLLFVGATGKSAIARFFLGSISRYLLHHTMASVWIARNKEWD